MPGQEVMLNGSPVEITEDSISCVVSRQVARYREQGKDDAFYALNLNDVINQVHFWRRELPRVELFFAVKCNPHPAVLYTLAKLGAGFDCTNKAEIEKSLDLGISPDNIVYGNPYKQVSHLRWARENNVSMVTFDNEAELYKTKEYYPEADLIVRIKPDDKPFFRDGRFVGNKFGANMKDIPHLLTVAKQLKLNVIGATFHAGACAEFGSDSLCSCVRNCREIFDIASDLGFRFHLLDIGGGFSGQEEDTFIETCKELRACLDELFPEGSGVRIIGEPGRFIVTKPFSLVTNVLAKHTFTEEELKGDEDCQANRPSAKHHYVLGLGIYHSFQMPNSAPRPVPYKVDVYNPEAFKGQPRFPSILFGSTLAVNDVIVRDGVHLPRLDVGDWLVFSNFGAYSVVMFTQFSSIDHPETIAVISEANWKRITANNSG